MNITYTKHGDYFYPDLALPPQSTVDIGRFGRMRKKYLKEHQPDTFALMLMENMLTQHHIDIDSQAYEQIDLITEQLAGENKELFLRFCNAYAEFIGECELDTFITGFRLGARFMMDTFLSDDAPFEGVSE